MDKPDVGTREYCLIFAELITAARRRGTVTYQELADLIGLPVHGNYMGKMLASFLFFISHEEAKHGRPMLSAIVVNVGGMPGEGYFLLAEQLGLLTSKDAVERQAFWEQEKKKVYDTWRKTFPRKEIQNHTEHENRAQQEQREAAD